MGKKNWIIDENTGERKLDKRTPYRKALDENAELKVELAHEQARNAELQERTADADSAAAERFFSNVRLGAELTAVKREFVALAIDHAALKVTLAERDLEIAKLLGPGVLDEINDSFRVDFDVARPITAELK